MKIYVMGDFGMDDDAVVAAINSMGDRICDKLDEICERLDCMDQRVDFILSDTNDIYAIKTEVERISSSIVEE